MTATSKSPLSVEERKERKRAQARLRKQRFDERMKNGGGDESAGARSACVLYLNADARAILRRNRVLHRLRGHTTLLDSELVEALLIEHRKREEIELPTVEVMVDGQMQPINVRELVDRLEKATRQNITLRARLKWWENTDRTIDGSAEQVAAAAKQIKKPRFERGLDSAHQYTQYKDMHRWLKVANLKRLRDEIENDPEAIEKYCRKVNEFLEYLFEEI